MVHSNENTLLPESLLKGLACAAISPGLRSVLLFNASYRDFKTTAAILTQMLEASTGKIIEQASLGVSELDDDLWGSLTLYNNNHQSVTWQQGSLAGTWKNDSLRLILIPDLTKLSLAAARACVMLVEADVAHLERHGQHKRWRPEMCWLANCASSEVGSISPHLLDRFSLRLNWQSASNGNRAEDLLEQISNGRFQYTPSKIFFPVELEEEVYQGAQYLPMYTDDALQRVLLCTAEQYTPRRDIALARYARAVAQLEGSKRVTATHVDTAAILMGLLVSAQQQEERALSRPEIGQVEGADNTDVQPLLPSSWEGTMGQEANGESAQRVPGQGETHQVIEPVYASDPPLAVDVAMLPVDPYPEDKAPVEREAASLRLPLLRYAASRTGHGTIIGVERANTLHDLALVETLFAAAPFQPIRRKYAQKDSRHLLLSAADLRSYRREPVAEHMLLILLDYTCLRNCDWQQALLPYLRKAYTERASIGIVQVGVGGTTSELKAELVTARSMLVPRIALALAANPGRATPLAHGFDLALRTLRHALQHGRSTVQDALFVVISDGRGNVPLEASLNGRIVTPIHRKGIEDALNVAQGLRDLKGVQVVFLNPQPTKHRELPLDMADVLGAEMLSIPQLEGEEV